MGILDWLFSGNDDATGTTVDPAVIAQRIEQVVGIVNPRLKLVAGYRRKLAPAVEQAVLYCREIESQIPPTIEATERGWAENPVLRAVFASAHDIPAVFSRSRAVQDFFEKAPEVDQVWATLRFLRREETSFGVVARGDVVQHDVMRTCISFVDKKAVLPSASERDARIEIRRRAFKFLATEALRQIASSDMRCKDLAVQRSMLQSRLTILKGQRAGLETMLGHGGRAGQQVEDVEARLAENEEALTVCPTPEEVLDNAIDRVQQVLTHGPDYIHISTLRLRLSQMNVVVPEGSDEPAVDIALPLVVVKSAPVVSLLACSFPRSGLIRRRTLLSEAQRLVC
ncbi:hypothetical protein [Accumulibacter sp.]|uniref:hypothetical protein n=1 Tax=Accumulibacter sp. TaxID=2053492 RepID=UPI0025FD934B|nr:hypothetical protein [Accumulibacter sp.]MCM8626308.1 hypothetical protein [Accumulibacter sp.]